MFLKTIRITQKFFPFFILLVLLFSVIASGSVDLWAQTISHLLVFVSFVGWLLCQIKLNRLILPKILVSPAIGLILLSIIVSYLFSQSQWNSRAELFNWISYFMFFWLGIELQDRKKVVINGLIICSLFIVGIQLFQRFSQGVITAYSTLINENVLAGYYLLLIPIVLFKNGIVGGELIFPQPRKSYWLIITIMLLTGLVITGSSGAWLSLGAILSWYLYKNMFNTKKKKSLILVSISILFVAIFVYKFNQPYVYNRFLWWISAVKMFLQYPLQGIGLDNFARYYPQYKIGGLNSLYAHNYYLQLIAETGIGSLLGFGWLVYLFWKQKKRDFVISLGLFAVLIHNFIDYNLAVPAISFIFWFMLGLAWENEIKIKLSFGNVYRPAIYGIIILLVGFLSYENVKLFLANRSYSQGTYLLEQKQFIEAEKKYLKTLSMLDNYSPANYGLSIIYTNRFLQDKHRSWLYEAMLEIETAIKKEKKYAPYWVERGWLCCLNKDLKNAAKSLQKAKLLGAIPVMTNELESYINKCKR